MCFIKMCEKSRICNIKKQREYKVILKIPYLCLGVLALHNTSRSYHWIWLRFRVMLLFFLFIIPFLRLEIL